MFTSMMLAISDHHLLVYGRCTGYQVYCYMAGAQAIRSTVIWQVHRLFIIYCHMA